MNEQNVQHAVANFLKIKIKSEILLKVLFDLDLLGVFGDAVYE